MSGKSPLILICLFCPLGCSPGVEDEGAPRAGGDAGVWETVDGGAGGSAAGPDAGGAGSTGGGGGEESEPDGGSEESAPDALIVPPGLSVAPLSADNGGLTVIALTLRQGADGGELYAAVRSDRDTPACSPSFSVNLYDQAEQHVGTGLSGLLVRRFYRMADGSSTVACVGPGEVTMVAIKDLPSTLVLKDLARLEYWSNFWALDVVPLGEIGVDEVQAVTTSTGVAYTGALVNGLDVPVTDPSVAVFPLNRAGRPLGVTFWRGTIEVPPGGTWEFETEPTSEDGVDFAAYPASGP